MRKSSKIVLGYVLGLFGETGRIRVLWGNRGAFPENEGFEGMGKWQQGIGNPWLKQRHKILAGA